MSKSVEFCPINGFVDTPDHSYDPDFLTDEYFAWIEYCWQNEPAALTGSDYDSAEFWHSAMQAGVC